MQVSSSQFGHLATFYTTRPINDEDHPHALVEWGPAKIAVPSGSVLDCPAIVKFNRIYTSERSARKWCNRVGATFHSIRDGVFVFQVEGFSSYSFFESDEEDEEDVSFTPKPNPNIATQTVEKNPPSSAGRTPFRRPRALRPPPTKNNVDASSSFRSNSTSYRQIVTAPIDDDSDVDLNETKQDPAADTTAPNGNGIAPGSGTQNLQLVPRTRGGVPPAVRAAQFWANLAPSPSATRMRNALFSDHGKQLQSDNNLDVDDSGNNGALVPDEDRMIDVTPAKRRAHARQVRFIDTGSGNKQTPRSSIKQDLDAEMADVATPTSASPSTGTEHTGTDRVRLRERVAFPTAENSVTNGHEGSFTDASLMMGRSFRLAFSQDGRYVQPSYAAIAGRKSFVASVVPLFGEGVSNERAAHVYFLLLHINVWKHHDMNNLANSQTLTQDTDHPNAQGDVQFDDEDEIHTDYEMKAKNSRINSNRRIKVPSLEPGFSQSDVQDNFIDQFIFGLKENPNDRNDEHALVLFDLVRALWKSSKGSGVTGAENLLSRLADWGRGPAGSWFDADTPQESSLRKALCLMSIGDVQGAAETAIAVGHVRLALMIARALEAPKDDLRADAEAQLLEYRLEGLEINQTGDNMNDFADDPAQQASILDNCSEDDLITVDERMLLLLLAGQVAPVARYLNVSWYRVFIMELIFGAGCVDAPLGQRVTAAMDGVDASKISFAAPHGQSEDLDVAYHVLKLFSHPSNSYPITSGIYSSRGFIKGSALDARFPWCLHQVLTSVVGPRCTNENVAWHLAEAYALQLFAMGLPLWGFYVLCSGSPPEATIRDTLLRKWPEISADFSEWNVDGESTVTQHSEEGHVEERRLAPVNSMMNAEVFLVSVLGVPVEWIHEAKATQFRYQGDALKECAELVRIKSIPAAAQRAHKVLVNNVFPNALAAHDNPKLALVKSNLAALAHRGIPGWAEKGQLVFDYLRFFAPGSEAIKVDVNLCKTMAEKLPELHRTAETPMQIHAAETIADAVIAAYRALVIVATQHDEACDAVVSALENIPCSDVVARRTAVELTQVHTGHAAVVNRYAAAHPIYAPFIANVLDD